MPPWSIRDDLRLVSAKASPESKSMTSCPRAAHAAAIEVPLTPAPTMPMRFFATVNARLDLNVAPTITDLMLLFYVQRMFFSRRFYTAQRAPFFLAKMSNDKAVVVRPKSAKNNRNSQCDFSGVYPCLWR